MNHLIRKGADSKVSLYKDKGGRMMICHPYLVTKRMTRHTPLLQEKRIYALSETNKTRFPA